MLRILILILNSRGNVTYNNFFQLLLLPCNYFTNSKFPVNKFKSRAYDRDDFRGVRRDKSSETKKQKLRTLREV